ncbi:MAG: hypothetical protein M9883_10115 [Methylobacteriaceae bacterium]|nr:hypothetical protein [Methylobacteriaceae bacterium]
MQKPRMYGNPARRPSHFAAAARAADYKDKHKHQINKHYDEGKTLGEIVRDQAKALGLDAWWIRRSMGQAALPADLQQSRIDYLGELSSATAA